MIAVKLVSTAEGTERFVVVVLDANRTGHEKGHFMSTSVALDESELREYLRTRGFEPTDIEQRIWDARNEGAA